MLDLGAIMAGEIEEQFSFNFQADSLHSGSISFGRFESESLSWERRSSFSHNRYLEEVEKCSKPGSVIEKKAYFEAHFKKKALLCQSSSECQNGTEYQTSENDISENMGYREEFEHVIEGNPFTHFDESPDGSDHHGECELMECEREDMRDLYSDPHMEPAFNNADVVIEGELKHLKLEETHQTDAAWDKLLLDNDAPEIEVKENPNNETENVDEVSKAIESSPKRQTSGKDVRKSLECWRTPSPKVRAAMETKLINPRSKSQVNIPHRNVSSESSKDSAKNQNGRERESSRGVKTDKLSSHIANPTPRSIRRTPRSEDSESLKAKLIHDNKSSEKELRAKKVVEPQLLASEKVVSRAQQTSNRPKWTVNSSKPDMKWTPAVFSFKSEERAEKRKELEEKMHAKEAEMNQMHARTQAFFQRWWRDQSEAVQHIVRQLVSLVQLELINGGMCMHDEASPHYIDMIDQTTLGHQFIKEEFGLTPRIGWQIDPFGHSAVQAYLLGAEVGFDSLFFGRIDYQDRAKRKNEKSLEVVWRGSKSLGSSAQIFAGAFPVNYEPPPGGFYFEVNDVSPIVQDDINLFDYNVQDRVNDFVAAAVSQWIELRVM